VAYGWKEEMLRVAVIGLRGIGTNHAVCYDGDPLAELVSCCDLLPERAEATAQRFGARAYTSLEAMLANEQLDAVSVATGGVENGSAHFAPVMQCLNAGLHVLCEKPLSNDIGEAREMERVAGEKSLYLGVNLNHRFVAPAARAREWIAQGDLGELLLINMALWISNANESTEWFHLRALHPHSIDVMRYFCGPVRRVQAFCTRPDGRRCWSNASINMEFHSGVVGHLTGSYDMSMLHPIERCEVAGTKGRFVLENVYETLTLYPRESPELRVLRNSIFGGAGGFDVTFKNRIHRWLEQITAAVARDEIEGSGADGLAAQEVIEAAIESFQHRSVVEVANG
jgi:predicted dehydrogenase